MPTRKQQTYVIQENWKYGKAIHIFAFFIPKNLAQNFILIDSYLMQYFQVLYCILWGHFRTTAQNNQFFHTVYILSYPSQLSYG